MFCFTFNNDGTATIYCGPVSVTLPAHKNNWAADENLGLGVNNVTADNTLIFHNANVHYPDTGRMAILNGKYLHIY